MNSTPRRQQGCRPHGSRQLDSRKLGHRRRSGFTLLEVMLAISISVVLLFALYIALNTQYFHSKAGREILEESNLARSILTRISRDVSGQLGPIHPDTLIEQSTDLVDPTATGSDDMATDTGSTETVSAPFNMGVQGDSARLILTVSRMHRDLTGSASSTSRPTGSGASAAAQSGGPQSDLRRITYWLVGDKNGGLARQELTNISGPEASSLPPDIANANSYVIAGEVVELTWEYFDGTGWLPAWDSNALDTNSQKPMGPPAAIAVTIKLSIPISATRNREVTYRHVMAIQSANSFLAASETELPLEE